eukprot:8009811-Alexandrium_andersonii.AAC.1
MSASLVGSEMCIRDRHVLAQAALRETCLANAVRAAANAGRLPFEAAVGTVSYTHLTLPTICSV